MRHSPRGFPAADGVAGTFRKSGREGCSRRACEVPRRACGNGTSNLRYRNSDHADHEVAWAVDGQALQIPVYRKISVYRIVFLRRPDAADPPPAAAKNTACQMSTLSALRVISGR